MANYYYVGPDNQACGPIAPSEFLKHGLSSESLVCPEGGSSWTRQYPRRARTGSVRSCAEQSSCMGYTRHSVLLSAFRYCGHSQEQPGERTVGFRTQGRSVPCCRCGGQMVLGECDLLAHRRCDLFCFYFPVSFLMPCGCTGGDAYCGFVSFRLVLRHCRYFGL